MNAEQLATEIRAMQPNAGIARVEIEGDHVRIHTARPGLVIGRRGSNLGVLQDRLEAWFGRRMQLNVVEIRYPEVEPQLIADVVLLNLQRGVALERMQKHVTLAAKRDARVRIEVTGSKGEHVFEAEAFEGGSSAKADDGEIFVEVRVLTAD